MEASEMTDSSCGKVKSEILYPSEKPQEDNSDSSPNKQNSIFSLSMDEIEGKTGKSFGSMNLDELLNNLWNVEDSSNPTQNERTNDVNIADPINFPIKNSFSIPTPLCNKTLEEVWEEINRNQSTENNPNGNCHGLCQGQPTLGEMTLEDFLVKVGVVQDGFILSLGPKVFDSYRNHCAKFSSTGTCLDPYNGQGPIMGPEFAQPNNGNNIIANGSPMYQVFTPSGAFVGEASNSIGNGKCNGARDMGDPLTKRRTANGPLELAVERRQRRMIKNRESAARSRARKQAYTAELEIELTQLREENARLRMILAESENKRKKEVVKGKSSTKAKQREEKLKTMRRSISLAW